MILGKRCLVEGLPGTIIHLFKFKHVQVRLDDGALVSIHRSFVTVFENEVTQPGIVQTETVTRDCAVCGVNINHLRPQTRTCSAKCRKALSRREKP